MKSESGAAVHSEKFLKQRKFFMVLPLMVLPFVLMLLWALGIVGEVKAFESSHKPVSGLNLTLPSAAPSKDSLWNKMQFYEKADRDSAKMRAYLKSDPYRKLELDVKESDVLPDSAGTFLNKTGRTRYDPYPSERRRDQNEERVYKKLEALNRELEKVDETREPSQRISNDTFVQAVSPDVARLEAMMQSLQTEPSEDRELSQLNEMLDKIMRIQNPSGEVLKDSLQASSLQHSRQVFTIEKPREDFISVLEPERDLSRLLQDSLPSELTQSFEINRFYSLEEEEQINSTHTAIAAMIAEDQTLVSGSTVRLQVLQEMYINGVHIPAHQLVHGVATLNGERLAIKISSIAYHNNLLPVSLTVHDADGIAGVHVPGAITRDVAKLSAAQSVQQLGSIGTLDPSFGAQMATAGLQAAQNLIGKSAKLVRVYLKAGYQVLLRDDNVKSK